MKKIYYPIFESGQVENIKTLPHTYFLRFKFIKVISQL